MQFFSSHYNATRLGNPDTQRIFLRVLGVTLEAIKDSSPHPLAREIRLQVTFFGLRVLKTSNTIGAIAQWRLKDSILAAALSWFSSAPKWSFGSSNLQLKTEIRLISDVLAALKSTGHIGSQPVGNIQSLVSRETLLVLLLESEQSRLSVWASPLHELARSSISTSHVNKNALEVRPHIHPVL